MAQSNRQQIILSWPLFTYDQESVCFRVIVVDSKYIYVMFYRKCPETGQDKQIYVPHGLEARSLGFDLKVQHQRYFICSSEALVDLYYKGVLLFTIPPVHCLLGAFDDLYFPHQPRHLPEL